jgi:hypothetical protein
LDFIAILESLRNSLSAFAELKKIRTDIGWWKYYVPETEKDITPSQQSIAEIKAKIKSNLIKYSLTNY